jgi:peptidoglycan/LPS O-acetylase OafA/YrhL
MAAAEVTSATASRWANGVPWFRIGCLGSAALIAYAAVVGSVPVVLHYFWIDLAVGVCVAMMLAGLADSRPRRVRDFLNTVGLRTVGRFSYTIYLIHVPILALIWLYVVQPLHWAGVPSFFLMLGLALPVVLVVSYGFSALFEQPFVRNRSWADFQRSFRRLKVQRAA